MREYGGGYKGEARGGGRAATSASDAVEGKWGFRVHQTQEMKGKEGTGDPGGPDAKSGRYSSGSGLCPSGEKGFFADVYFLQAVVGDPCRTRHELEAPSD